MILSLGITFALIAAVLNAALAMTSRVAMRKVTDIPSWGFCYEVLAGIVFLIPAILLFAAPTEIGPYILMFVGAVLWTIYVFISWTSHQQTPVSIRQTVNASKNIFVILAAFILVGESITTHKILGSVIILSGVAISAYIGKFQISKGVVLTFASAVTQAVARVVDKMAIPFFNTPTYAALQYFLPAIGVGITQKNFYERVKVLVKTHWKILVVAVLFGSLAAYFQLEAYRHLDVAVAVMIMELSTVFATIGGIVLLNERENIIRKLMGAIIVVLGVYVITL